MSLKRLMNSRVTCFFCVFLFLLVVSRLFNVFEYYFDSAYYLNTGDSVFQNGFHITQFPETFRGYFFMVLFSGMKLLFAKAGLGAHWAWRVMVNLMLSTVTVVFLPEIFSDFISDISDNGLKRKISSLIVFFAIFILYWGSFIQYVLSDFPAVFFFLGGCYFLLRWLKEEYSRKTLVNAFISGMLFYAAYNTRVVWLYGIIVAVVSFIVKLILSKKLKIMLGFIAMLIGVILISLPQGMINYNYRGVYTPRVLTEQFTGYKNNLQAQQLCWGLNLSHAECYIGDLNVYPENAMTFLDSSGHEIIIREQLDADIFGYKDIFKLFFKYPFDMLGIYTRHFLGVMTPIFLEAQITNAMCNKGFYIAFMIILWILSAVSIIFLRKEYKKAGFSLFIIFSAILPGALQCAGAAENRFFIAAHIFLYYYLAFVVDYKKLRTKLKGKLLPVLLVSFFVFCLWLSNMSAILWGNYGYTNLFHG